MEPIGVSMGSMASMEMDRRPRLAWLGTAGGVFLGAVLLVAVWAKALDPAAFAEQIRIEGLDFLLSAQAVALIALALEAGLGLALLLGVRRLWVLVPAALLVAFFLFLTGRAWWMSAHGLREAEACGCFGNLVQRTPEEAFWQDLLLLVPALLLSFVGRGGQNRRSARFPTARVAAAAVAAVATALFAWRAPELPLDDLATRLRPGVDIQDLCAGGENPVCLSTAVGALNAYANRGGAVWVLSASPEEKKQAFFWRFGPSFQIVETPEPLMRPLYRRLPRSFRVEDGKVTETWSGLPQL
jgi:uncharacterized membrane protein YphA (DoxX/SURF4 family)